MGQDSKRLFKTVPYGKTFLTWGDAIAIFALLVAIFIGVRLAVGAPAVILGPEISLSPRALPWYTLRSVLRMAAAYVLSVLFSLVYGRVAAYNARAEKILMPLLDVLQSVPILSFLPVVLLSLSSFLPEDLAVELASIILIFTSQVWNLTFAWYQSLITIPKELTEASRVFRLNTWLRFTHLELPFGAGNLVWNSMLSWAGGWFFLMAAEIFTIGQRDFRLPGLGAYLQEAANQGNLPAIGWGLLALVGVILALDQFAWRPLLAWADRFKIEMVTSDSQPSSWFYDAIRSSRLIEWVEERITAPLSARLDKRMFFSNQYASLQSTKIPSRYWLPLGLALAFWLGMLYAGLRMFAMLALVPASEWIEIGIGLGATALRVVLSLVLALAWTVPVGVAIGMNRRLAAFLQPVVQIAASIPATALFPVLLLLILNLPGSLNIAAVLLMLLGAQWYLLFNVIAGVSAIPEDLKHTTALLQLGRIERWKSLILPALFPYLVTGAITAGGGAWNASIVAEYFHFSGETFQTIGIGALIARSTAAGDYPLLLAATLSMVLVVILTNRLLWRRLFILAEEKYRME